jgi:hypothetical protein
MALPSPAALRAAWNVRHPGLLPLYYVYRPLRYGAMWVRSGIEARGQAGRVA